MSTPNPVVKNELVLNASQQDDGYAAIMQVLALTNKLVNYIIPTPVSPGETEADSLDTDIVNLVDKWKATFQAVDVADKKTFMEALHVLRQQLAAVQVSPTA